MNKKRFECVFVEDEFGGTYRRLKDNKTGIVHMTCDVADLLNFQNTQIKCLKEENEQLRETNKRLDDDLYNCRANKNIISKVLKLWQDTLAEYDIYTIKDFRKSFELDAKTNKEKDEKIKELQVKVLNLELK